MIVRVGGMGHVFRCSFCGGLSESVSPGRKSLSLSVLLLLGKSLAEDILIQMALLHRGIGSIIRRLAKPWEPVKCDPSLSS